ncbi:MAG: single-stranded DNA-binding protein [Planctomycetes bacterium]|nr:single-stranded DNA-binding protein [Planctomycetota bacterium]
MPNLNFVLLMGNMTRDPELRYTPGGSALCKFGLAMNRRWKKPDGTMQEEVCFVDVTAWKRSAELCSEYLKKGQPVCVEGRLKLDRWEKDGQKRSKLEVVASRIHFVGSNRGGSGTTEHEDGEDASRSTRPSRAGHALASARTGAASFGPGAGAEEAEEGEGESEEPGEEESPAAGSAIVEAAPATAGREEDPPF